MDIEESNEKLKACLRELTFNATMKSQIDEIIRQAEKLENKAYFRRKKLHID